jgi:hypothetical protein
LTFNCTVRLAGNILEYLNNTSPRLSGSPAAALHRRARGEVRPVAEPETARSTGVAPAAETFGAPRMTSGTSDLETPARSATLVVVGRGPRRLDTVWRYGTGSAEAASSL